jgi:hypothetical protein
LLCSHNEQMSANPLANAKLLADDEFDLALDYAADQGWFEDAEVDDDATWVSLTPAGVTAAKS